MSKVTVNPYLNFNGNCEAAMNFYKNALGGELNIMRFGDSPAPVPEAQKNMVMHATLTFKDATIMASDGQPDQPPVMGTNIHMSLNSSDVEQGGVYFNNLAAGGTVTMPYADQFWGARFGMLTDKFGVHWMVNSELPK